MDKLLDKNYWKKGAAESLSFIMLAPTILIIFAMLATVVQSGCLKEKLEYTTYVAARAAVVSDSMDNAKKNAMEVAKADLSSYGAEYDPESLKVTISYVSGSKWEKGNYISCTVSVKFRGLFELVNKRKKFTLAMAIERPKEDTK